MLYIAFDTEQPYLCSIVLSIMCCYTPSVLDQACAPIGLAHMQHQAVDICYCSNDDISDCSTAKLMPLAYQLYVLPVLLSLQRCFCCTHSVTIV